MSTPVVSINQSYSLEMVEKIMTTKDLGHLIVTDMGKLSGIIADSDVKKYRSRIAGTDVSNTREEDTLRIKAHQFMTRDPITVHEDSHIDAAITLLLEHKIHALPVVNDKGSCRGIITDTDLLRLFKKVLSKDEE